MLDKHNADNKMLPSEDLLQRLQNMLERNKILRSDVWVHAGVATKGHAPKSYHYKGEAVDYSIQGKTLYDLFTMAVSAGFTGIGAYPLWKSPGVHVDVRKSKPVFWTHWKKYVYYDDPFQVVKILMPFHIGEGK